MESNALRELLTSVLVSVNYINHGWQPIRPLKEYAVMAFRVESLLRLKDFRSSAAQGVSLMHFLLAHLGHPALVDNPDKSAPESETLIDRLNRELELTGAAAKADFGELRKTLTCLREEVKFLEKERADMNKVGCALVEPGDEGCVARVVDDTLNDCQRHLAAVQQDLDEYDELSVKLLDAFGEKAVEVANVRDVAVKTFFGQLHQALGMLSQAWVDLSTGAKGEKFALLSGPIPEEMQKQVETLKESFPPPPAPAQSPRQPASKASSAERSPRPDATQPTPCGSDADGRGPSQTGEDKENSQLLCPRRQSRGSFGGSFLSQR
jgi:hypothetical protein